MLRNKIIIKKIRNICILLMAIIIMFGVYNNIRNSKAENVIQIELDVIDKSNMLDTQTMSIEATETSEGNYLVNLPISVNKNLITKYYTSSGEEIDVDTENNIATMQLTSEEVANRKVQVQTDYDTKEVTIGEETKLFYKKELTNEPFIDNNQDESNANVTDAIDDTTINQDVTVTGYMPEDAKLEVKEIDLATLTNVKISNEKQTKQKAYEFSIYQIITKINNSSAEQTDKSTYVENEDESTEGSNSETEKNEITERVEYDPSAYGEKVTVKTNYDLTNVNATIYVIDEKDKTIESESTTSNDRENISFETDKTDKTIKYIIATEEINNQDDSTISNDDNNVNENTSENVNDVSKDETTESPNEIENSEWKVVESKSNIPNGTATIKVKGPEDILTEEWINVIINGESVDEGITKKIENKEKLSDGVLYTIVLTELPTDTNQIKIGLVKPQARQKQTNDMAKVQTLALDDENSVNSDETLDETLGNSTSDDSGIMLLATTYNALKTTTSETETTSPFLGNSSVKRQNVENVTIAKGLSGIGRGLRRSFSGLNNTGSGHSTSTTTWKDLTGNKNGTLNGGTWGTDYVQLDGKDDWINLGYMTLTKNVTLDVTFALSEYPTTDKESQEIMVNFEGGGLGLHLYGKTPVFTICVGGKYIHLRATSAVKLNTKTRITGTYDGKNMCIYVNGKLEAKVAQTGDIDLPQRNTIMAMGCNPSGTGISSETKYFLKMKVYNAKIHNTALTASEVASSSEINGYYWDVSANQDKSIMAWTPKLTAPYTVHIESASTIYANKDSTNLFSYIGNAETCKATETITGIGNLDVSNTTNMTRMFQRTGNQAMTKLDLGSNFNTSNVTAMGGMFGGTGYKAMTTLNLGSKFNTSKVTSMDYMFQECGGLKMTSLSLGSNFNTSNVTNMQYMFHKCGYTAMTSLNLGSNFNTSSVTTMYHMFDECGYTAMTSLNLGSLFDTSKVTNMASMFSNTGYTAMTSLDLGDKFNTRSVTNMGHMFYKCGYTAMTSLDLGDNFDTSNVQYMDDMFAECGYTALTSLDLGKKFNTSKVKHMEYMFRDCGTKNMIILDLGPAFTKIPNETIQDYYGNTVSANNLMFANTGKSGATIYAPESIYKNQTSFKLSSTDTSTSSGTVAVSSGRTVVPKYKPEWKVTGTTIDSTNKAIKITITGATNTSDYTSNVTTALKTSDISVWIDGTELTGVTKSLTTPSTTTASSITHTLTISNLEESARKSGKSYKEWSGNITLKIGGRGEATSTYSKNVLKDAYGNQSMSQIDTTGTWVDVDFKDSTKSSANASGKLFADLIAPEFTYEYANTTIDRGNKKVTIIFSIADKYFSSSTLTSDTTASKVTVTVDGKTVTNDTKQRKKLSKTDITETIDGRTNTKVGEKYTLELTNLDQGTGGDYSGIVKLAFAEGTVTDKSGNKSVSKTITVGIDDPTTGDGHTSGAIVDVVSPVWKTQNLKIDKTNKKVTVDLIATDKYLTGTSNSTLTTSKIALTVDGNTNANTAITKTLSTATFSTNSSTGLKEIKYTLTLSNWEQSTKQSGKSFLEYSGTTKITIPAGTVTDQYTNKSLEQTFDLGHVDFIKPRIETVSTTRDTSAKTETIIFNVIDKYLDTSDAVASSEITVYVDGENASTLSKTLTRVTANDVKATINGTSRTVSQQYKLVLSNFEQSARNTKNYKDWSGTVKIDIVAGAVKDQTSGGSVNTSEKTTINAGFVDFIKPDLKYVHQSSDINKDGKSYTMTFTVTDKYYTSGKLGIDDLTIKMQNGQKNSSGSEIIYNLKNEPVTISLKAENLYASNIPITNTSGTITTASSQLIGHTYTLTISNLEQLEAKTGLKTVDYSGIVTVAVTGSKILDRGPTGNNTSKNGNAATTITSGVNIPGGSSPTDAKVVDVVAPVWKKESSTVDIAGQTATITFKGTDTYYASNSLTAAKIKVYVNGSEVSSTSVSKTLSTATSLKEQRKEFGKTTTVTKQYGVQYTLTIKGFTKSADQIKIQIPANTLTDSSGNNNVATDMVLYSALASTIYESSDTSAFLGNSKIQRQNIENITFESSIPSNVYNASTGEYVNSTAWDVSARKDKSIIAWYEKNNWYGALKVHIASDGEIYANPNSSYLFANIGRANICTATSTITNINLLNVSSVTNMNSMFKYCGYKAMTSLNLGANFDTSNVTSMNDMFDMCGYKAMTSLDLENSFDTSNVTSMNNMFSGCGRESMTIFSLENNFNTSKVTDMSGMFSYFGDVLTNLNLGSKFDTGEVISMSTMFQACGVSNIDLGSNFNTSKVKTMNYMFNSCGFHSMTSLDLGDNFDTSEVTNMKSMFEDCGTKKMTSLSLGNKFNTTSVTDMSNMFNSCGSISMTKLDLGPAFTKIASTNTDMFTSAGKSGAVINAPESIYKNKSSFKLSSTDTTTASGKIAVSSGRTVVPKYKPEWTVTGTTIDSTNKAIKITIKGATNTSDYTSNVTTALKASDISVWIDGTELTGVNKTITTSYPTTSSSVTHTLTIKNFEESARRAGKSYKEWSGNISLKIGGRGEATSTYSKNVLKDAYGNQSMSQIDTTGTWVDVDFKDSTKSSANASGKLFTDFIVPEFTYEYANTTIDQGNKKVTIIFSIADKYFSSSTLTSDTTASNITVTVDGKTVTNDTTQRKKLSKTDITETIDGKANTKVGEKYTLELTNLDQGGGGDYSGIVKLAFAEGTVTDKSGNKSVSKTITVGIDDPTTGDGHTSGAIVDVVSPVWKTQNLKIDKTNKKVTVDLIATDKYLTGTSNSTLTTSKIALTVDGNTNANTAITKTLSTATFSTNSSTGLKEIKYTLTLSNWEQSTKQSGKSFLEYSGTTKITIPAGTVTDQYTNKSLEQTFDLGHVDFIKPRIETVSTTRNTSAKTETIVFNVIDKYLDTSDLVTADEISVLVDKEATTGITKTLTRVTANDVKATINGTSQTVSQQYQLVLSNFEQTRTSINSARNFTDWSGTVSLEIKAGAVNDKTSGNSVNTNDKTTIDADFVDFIQPKVTYKYATSDINYDDKTFIMTFDITDKYYKTGTTITTDNLSSYLTIKVDGVDITNNSKVTKKIIATEDITAGTTARPINKTVDGTVKTGLTNQVVGKRYTLELSNLEQAINIGDYLDYSGVITVAVKAGVMTDNGPANDGVNTNSNIATTITSGVNIPGGTGTGTVVDVVDPIWERAGTVVTEPLKQTATLVIRGTDKYFASCSLTSSQIKIVVNGEEQTSGINVELTKDTSVTLAYGVQYKVKITGFVSNAYQVKMIIPAGTLTDESGNTNKETEFLLYSCLRKTNTENYATSPFLGNTKVQRQYVEKIILQDNLDGANDTRWDVSAQEDGSIIAWYEKNNSKGTYTVYIGSYSGINANADSSYLFANIGNNSACAVTGNTGATDGTEKPLIENIELLNVGTVDSMAGMFDSFGCETMKSFSLGNNFDTSNVTNMTGMFYLTGDKAMTSFDLGDKFDTSKVIDMSAMFSNTGSTAMTSLDLGNKFDTRNVTNMNNMFAGTGSTAMTSLNLGDKFDTSNVTIMYNMFDGTGYTAMTSLDLGNKFNTSKVTKMNSMFSDTGYTAMTSLDLGDKFDTSNVTDMGDMFSGTGYTAMTSLDLGDKFYTARAAANGNMYNMFIYCGHESLIALDLGPVFTIVQDDMFAETGKEGAVIYAPESVFSDEKHFKYTYNNDVTFEYERGTINPIYKPEFTKVSSCIDTMYTYYNGPVRIITIKGEANKSLSINGVNINYSSDINIKRGLETDDITLYIDGEKVENVQKMIIDYEEYTNEETGKTEVEYVIGLFDFEEDTRQIDSNGNKKLYTEWSGNISLQFKKGILKDMCGTQINNNNEIEMVAGNGNLSEYVDSLGEEQKILIKDDILTDSNARKYYSEEEIGGENFENTEDVMFADFIKPEFTYEYANTTIDHGNKKVIIIFTIADKYFSSSTLTSDTTASNITVTIDGKTIENEGTTQRKSLSKTDITETINGKEKKVGEKYTLTLTNLDKYDGGDYSGIVKLSFAEGTITDRSGNGSIAKTITIGVDDPSTGDGHDSGVIVDVVSPVWKKQNVKIDKINKEVTLDLIATDKYLTGTSNSNLTVNDITLYVDDDISANTAIKKTLSTPVFTTNETTGLKEIKYTLTLSNWEQAEKQDGKNFLEYSGTAEMTIRSETIIDDYTNKSMEYTFTLGHIDVIKPRIETVSTTRDESAKTETIVFNVIDKYLDTSDTVTENEISVYVDGENASTLTKTLTRVTANDVSATINGSLQVVSQQYKLVLSDFEKARNEKDYKDWSGTVRIDIAEDAVKDKVKSVGLVESGGNTNEKVEINADFVDFIKPDLKYVHQSADIDKDGKSYTMTFTVTDKYYKSGKLGIDDLTIKMQNGQLDSSGNEIVYNLKNEPVTISLQGEELKAQNVPVTNTSGNIETATELLIGHTYKLTISNLEQLEVKTGLTTKDYSGIVTVAVAGDKIKDRGPGGDNVSTNGNTATTITSGVSIPGGTVPDDAKVVDVVAPVWKKVSSSANAIDPEDKTSSTATITFKGTDTYYAGNTLTADKIKVFVNGEEVNNSSSVKKTLSTATELNEERKEFGKTTTVTKQYGVEYTLTIKGFTQSADQVKIQIPAGTLTDESGNSNKDTEMVLYSVLKSTATENAGTSEFLGNNKIQRQNIENITFETSVPSTVYNEETGEYVDSTAWDVSARGDKSIIAWYETSNANGALKVHIGSNDEIYANQNSTLLFAYIGYADICTATETITNIELLNVRSVINMNSMFKFCGYRTMKSLNLGENFDTSNVTDMSSMFEAFGYKATEGLDLGTKFYTNNVTNMYYMFEHCGYDVMSSLTLGENFDTSKVTNMSYMFAYCGYNEMTGLNLENKFITSKVTDMSSMFSHFASNKLTSLNLGANFDTSLVQYMGHMFDNTGYTEMTSLNLGDKFNTSSVTDMQYMFNATGHNKMPSLSLGEKFNTNSVTNMNYMFKDCGASSMTTLNLGPAFTKIADQNTEFMVNCGTTGLVIYAPESIYSNKTAFYVK